MNFPGPRGAPWCGPNADCNTQGALDAWNKYGGSPKPAPEVVSLFDLRRSALAFAIDWGGSGDNVDDLLATADDICDWLTRPYDGDTTD